ncbi:aminoacyl-tRNA synthetase [Ramlibacter sp. 2FC]|uniref:aminoacyl-tRNA synthetase n=1 Tax=Ramlibacter sp. 2FC TaxID=2502188 RepID=UPI0010F8FAAC|nr:aminoacyl-tRNA synthetase [Ramlibacter sp. 2FC]
MRVSDQDYFRSCVAKERQLAHLLGHKNVEECYESAGTLWDNNRALPQWTRDWQACGPLLARFAIPVSYGHDPGQADHSYAIVGSTVVHFADHPSKDRALMYGIVKEVIQHLEHPRRYALA